LICVSGCSPAPKHLIDIADLKDDLPSTEALVSGRLEFLHSEAYGGFSEILVRNEESLEMLSSYYWNLALTGGRFTWHLPPGDYLIAGMRWGTVTEHGLGARTVGSGIYPLLVRFSVPPGEPAVYVGSLVVDMMDGAKSILDDEYGDFQESLTVRFPERKNQPARSIMTLEVAE